MAKPVVGIKVYECKFRIQFSDYTESFDDIIVMANNRKQAVSKIKRFLKRTIKFDVPQVYKITVPNVKLLGIGIQ